MTSNASGARGAPTPASAQTGAISPISDALARVLCAVGIAGIAVVHVLDAPDTFHTTRYVFWLYVAVIVAAVPMISLLLHWRSPLVWFGAAALAAGPFLGYLWSRSIGLPGDAGDIGNWLDARGMASLFIEAVVISLSLTRLGMWARQTGAAAAAGNGRARAVKRSAYVLSAGDARR